MAESPFDIPLDEASELTRRYRELHGHSNKAVFFPKAQLQELLDQDQCTGIRMYFGCDEKNGDKLKLILVGTLPDDEIGDCGDDMLDIIKDRGQTCPPYSSCENPLNSD